MKPRFTTVKNTLLAFATPIRQHGYTNVESLNTELSKRILAMRDQSPGERKSNIGGWHSNGKLLTALGEPYGAQLGRMFVENVNAAIEVVAEPTKPRPAQLTIEAWANVNTRGDSNVSHIHPGCAWSGVYYVATGPKDAGGEIVFTDPRTAALMSPHPLNPFPVNNSVTVYPQPGMMIVFPSFLYHRVGIYLADAPRITIAFNLA
jgi:uncharacterized protein (TIGR02466 family)